jgi:hypothetical protein
MRGLTFRPSPAPPARCHAAADARLSRSSDRWGKPSGTPSGRFKIKIRSAGQPYFGLASLATRMRMISNAVRMAVA